MSAAWTIVPAPFLCVFKHQTAEKVKKWQRAQVNAPCLSWSYRNQNQIYLPLEPNISNLAGWQLTQLSKQATCERMWLLFTRPAALLTRRHEARHGALFHCMPRNMTQNNQVGKVWSHLNNFEHLFWPTERGRRVEFITKMTRGDFPITATWITLKCSSVTVVLPVL